MQTPGVQPADRGSRRRGLTDGRTWRVGAGTIAAAVAWFAIFGGLAVLIGRSALGDWRDARRDRDGWFLWLAVEQWWLTAVAATLALVAPIVLLLNA